VGAGVLARDSSGRWLYRQFRRAVLLIWWSLTLQLPQHAAFWLRARRTRSRPSRARANLLTDPLNPAALRFETHQSPVVSIIITSYGKVNHTLRCLASIAAWPSEATSEIIVIDDASGDADLVLLKLVRGIRVITNPINLGYLRSC
jgi:hypothetical protein